MMAARSLPYPGQLISLKFRSCTFIPDDDATAHDGNWLADVDEPMLVTWVEYGSCTLGTVHVMHCSGWTGWRSWADDIAVNVRVL